MEEQLAAGVAESGATVHLVDEGVDSGPILAQERVAVLDGDTPETLHARIKEIEHRLLPTRRRRAVRALISTYDKTGLDDFARGLAELGWELVASGGTAAYLEELGLTVEHVEALTDFPEMLGGRVKTLHPRIHAGILARRDNDEDVATLAEHGIAPFDLVCINLYPFEQVAAQRGVTEMEAVEMIDVGGPSMLRGAAKNFAHVAPVCRPERYGFVLDELRRSGVLSLETRRELAAEAFATSAAYEAAIATWFSERETFPDTHRDRAREGARPLVRREPAPARRVLRRARRANAPALPRRAAARQGALVQQPQRPLRPRECSRASSRCRPA